MSPSISRCLFTPLICFIDMMCCLSDEEFENLSSLKTLKRLSLAFNRITDACLVHLKGLVNLDSCKIGDEGLANLTGLTLLRSLVLSDTEIGSSGLRHISVSGIQCLHGLEQQNNK
ncbi:hypothetical protein S83_071087, partial [Arachis hypogaea]